VERIAPKLGRTSTTGLAITAQRGNSAQQHSNAVSQMAASQQKQLA
jgi:hypothetical protein